MRVPEAGIALKLLAVLPVRTELVIQLALFRVFEDFVGFVDFLEFVFRLLVARIKVRMVLTGQLFVSLGNFLGPGPALHTQKLVIVFI